MSLLELLAFNMTFVFIASVLVLIEVNISAAADKLRKELLL